jgi:sec-independent protein translocase protein TatB
MFDVGFSEICLVALVSLIVIGPEKLPQVARIAGFWLGKARHMIASVQQEIKEELYLEEVRQVLKEQSSLLDQINMEGSRLAQEAQQIQANLLGTAPSSHFNNATTSPDSSGSAPLPVISSTETSIQPEKSPLPTHAVSPKHPKSKQRRHGKK